MAEKIKVVVRRNQRSEQRVWFRQIIPRIIATGSVDSLRVFRSRGLIRVSDEDLAKMEKVRHGLLSNPPRAKITGRRGH